MKYRSRDEIIALILEAANGGAKKTKIMYKSIISSLQLEEYITYLVDNDLLAYNAEKHIFKSTEKGLILLHKYREMEQLLPNKIGQ